MTPVISVRGTKRNLLSSRRKRHRSWEAQLTRERCELEEQGWERLCESIEQEGREMEQMRDCRECLAEAALSGCPLEAQLPQRCRKLEEWGLQLRGALKDGARVEIASCKRERDPEEQMVEAVLHDWQVSRA